MKERKRMGIPAWLPLCLACLLALSGVIMLVRTFTQYNELSLERQDSQLRDMAVATDKYIAVQLNNFREDLIYILGRRGFVQAEDTWAQTGQDAELITRMQENLVMQDPLITTMLAIREGKIVLSTNGRTDYRFPGGMDGSLQPCFASDGTLYIAVLEATPNALYAALISAEAWYEELNALSGIEGNRLLLLGRQGKILLHQWPGTASVISVEELTPDNCDLQAVRHMVQSRTTDTALSASYRLTYPGSDIVHDMRMTTLPISKCANGYFIVGLTSDYDEITVPMHAAIIRLVVSGGMVIGGVVLMVLLLWLHTRRNDREIQRLHRRNAETQRLLEKTQELAHHQRLETIGTLAASIAHEFNNLLTPIMGYSILTLEGLPEGCDDLADNVTEIYEASRKAKTIIARMNDLARRNPESAFRTLSLADLAQRALEVAAPAQPPHVNAAVNCSNGPCLLTGNEMQLSQLLLNLVLNAFHAMEEEGGELTISITPAEDGTVLTVQDTGIGIAPEALPHIFEPFFTTKGPGKGTGLGLAIVHQVVESHGGSISVRSTPGDGTVFTLRFPLPESTDAGES